MRSALNLSRLLSRLLSPLLFHLLSPLLAPPRWRIRLVEAALVAAFAITAGATATAQAPKEVKIGIGGPLTTTSAGFGVEMRQAADLAIAERNGAGGLDGTKVIGVALDDKADASVGQSVAK